MTAKRRRRAHAGAYCYASRLCAHWTRWVYGDCAVEDLIDQILPARDIHLVVGPVGCGKETWMMQTASEWAQGKPVLGYVSRPLPFVYVSCTRAAADLLRTARMLEIENWLQPLLSLVDTDVETIEELLKHCAGLGVSVYWIESLLDLMDGDENRRRDVARFLRKVKRLCQTERLTVIGSIDSAKVVGRFRPQNPRERPQGSVAWGAHCGTQFNCDRISFSQASDPRRRLLILPRYAPDQEVLYKLDERGAFAEPHGVTEGTAFAVMDLLLDSLPEEQTLGRQYLREYGVSSNLSARTVDRWVTARLGDGKLLRVGWGQYQRRREVVQ